MPYKQDKIQSSVALIISHIIINYIELRVFMIVVGEKTLAPVILISLYGKYFVIIKILISRLHSSISVCGFEMRKI